jgi:hypothetical protein
MNTATKEDLPEHQRDANQLPASTDTDSPPRAAGTPSYPMWLLVVPMALLFVVPGFVCSCGHLDFLALFFTLPAFLIAWHGFSTAIKTKKSYLTIASMLIVVLAGVALGKNVVDVVLLGHDPLWPLR